MSRDISEVEEVESERVVGEVGVGEGNGEGEEDYGAQVEDSISEIEE